MSPLRTPLAVLVLVGLLISGPASATVKLLKSVRVLSDEPTDRVYFLTDSQDEARLLQLSDKLADAGARAIHVVLPDLIICDLPRSVNVHSLDIRNDIRIRFDHQLRETTGEGADALASVIERQIREVHDPSLRPDILPPQADDASGITMVEAREHETDAFPSSAARTATEDRLVFQNSDILAGRILVQVVFPESESNLEDWTVSSRDKAFASVVAAISSFQSEFRNADIIAIYNRVEDATTSLEPITMRARESDEKQWVADVMNRLGYDGAVDDYIDSVHRFNNAGRNQYRTDWVLTVFIVNAQRDSDHMFREARTVGWGYIGGPHIVTPYPAGFLGASMFVLIKREMAHVFWALDEQISSEHSCGTRSGYLNEENGNRITGIDRIGGVLGCPGVVPEGCIMNSQDAYTWGVDTFCDFSAAMLGTVDEDRNNVPDVFEAAPKVVFAAAAAETLVDGAPLLQFSAVSQAVPNRNTRQPAGQQIDYAVAVKDVAISVSGGPFVFFPPLDGRADELTEEFEVRLPGLPPGESTIDITTRNIYGAKSLFQKKTIFLIWLNYFNFFVDYETTGIRINWSMRGEMFGARFELVRWDAESGEDVVVASGLQPNGPSRNGITPFAAFDETAVSGVHYEYYITGSFDFPYQGAVRTFEFSSDRLQVIGPFARTGLLSAPAPNPFAGQTFVSVGVPETFTQAQGQSFEVRVPTAVSVAVYDVAGRRIKQIYSNSVFERVVTVGWDGTNSRGERVPLGIYFIKAEAGDDIGVKKVLLVR